MESWQDLIRSGDALFHQAQLEAAEQAYIMACERIEKHLTLNTDTTEEVQAALTSYHNLAECFKCQGRYLTAMEVLLKAHQIMSEGLRHSLHLPQKHAAFAQARRKTIVELKYFQWIMNLSQDATANDANLLPEFKLAT